MIIPSQNDIIEIECSCGCGVKWNGLVLSLKNSLIGFPTISYKDLTDGGRNSLRLLFPPYKIKILDKSKQEELKAELL